MEFSIPLSRGSESLTRSLYAALRASILAGVFPAGTRLPSTRSLAAQQGVSRTTVVSVYEQLLAEGFVSGRRGSGTYVSTALGTPAAPPERAVPVSLAPFGRAAARLPMDRGPSRQEAAAFDFGFGSDPASFPFAPWNRALLRRARAIKARDLDYGPAAGDERLRHAICAHLRGSRGVRADASRIIITNGSQQGLDLITRVLIERGERVVLEDPSYPGTSQLLSAAGARLSWHPVDAHGLNPARLPASARCVFITPSHQFPTGATLTLSRRLALLSWARQHDSIIIEDDYDGEFRYDGQPLESLQGLDEDSRVIYVGTFSRTLFPAMRIGYLIVPSALVPALTAAKWLCDRHTAHLEQQTLADFILSGAYGRHLRRLRRRNAGRRLALLEAVDVHLRGRVDVTGDAAGAHLVLWCHRPVNESEVVSAAQSRGISIRGIAPYYHGRSPRPGFILGYARLDETRIREGIRRLARLL